MNRTLLTIAGTLGFSAVLLGAFGAHGLRDKVAPPMLEIYRTGVLYHLVHAVVLVGIAGVQDRLRSARLTATLFAVGIAIFSGSLYILALSGVRLWGAVTPLGGVALLAGWGTLLLPRKPSL